MWASSSWMRESICCAQKESCLKMLLSADTGCTSHDGLGTTHPLPALGRSPSHQWSWPLSDLRPGSPHAGPSPPCHLRRSILKANLIKFTTSRFNGFLWLSCSKPFWTWVPYLACQGPNFPSAMVCFTHLRFPHLQAPKLRVPDWKKKASLLIFSMDLWFT